MLNLQRTSNTPLNRLLAPVLALAVVVAGGLAGAGSADANTPSNRISHVSLTVAGTPSPQQAAAYGQFIRDVQGAAGQAWTTNLGRTQTNQDALLRADINVLGRTLRLWFTPNNLYLRGFTTESGQTFAFNDDDYNLREAMVALAERGSPDINLLPGLGHESFRTLPYSGGYDP